MNEELLRAIYDNEGFADKGIEFEKFKIDISNSPELRQAILEKAGFAEKGIDLAKFESDLGINNEQEPNQVEDNRLTTDTTTLDTSSGFPEEQERNTNEDGGDRFMPEGTFGDVINSIPVIGDWIDDHYGAVKRGLAKGASVDDALKVMTGGAENLTEEEIQSLIDATNKQSEVGQSDEFTSFMDDGGFKTWEGWKKFLTSPTIATELLVDSFASMANGTILTAGAAGGAATAGTVALATAPLQAVPILGQAISGVSAGGAFVTGGFFAASTMLEATLAFTELLQEQMKKEGLDFNDANQVKTFLQADGKMKDLQLKSVGKGLTIGLVNTVSARAAGAVGARATSSLGKAGKIAAVDLPGEFVGDVLGREVAGQEFDFNESMLEAAGAGPGVVLAGVRAVRNPISYKIGEERVNEKAAKDYVEANRGNKEALERLTVEGDKKVSKLLADEIEDIDVRDGVGDNPELIKLEKERRAILRKAEERELTLVEEERLKEIKAKIPEVRVKPKADKKAKVVELTLKDNGEVTNFGKFTDGEKVLIEGTEYTFDAENKNFKNKKGDTIGALALKDRDIIPERIAAPNKEPAANSSADAGLATASNKDVTDNEEDSGASGETGTPTSDITDQEFNDFIDSGNVSAERLQDIAGKVKNDIKLNEREVAIFNDKTSEINKILREQSQKEQAQSVQEETSQSAKEESESIQKENETVEADSSNLVGTEFTTKSGKVRKVISVDKGKAKIAAIEEDGSQRELNTSISAEKLAQKLNDPKNDKFNIQSTVDFDNKTSRESLIGKYVNFQGVEGVLLKDNEGNLIVDTGSGDVVVEGGLSNSTNKDLGISLTQRPDINPEQIFKVESDPSASVDPAAIQTDFGTGRILYGGKEFKFLETNTDDKGNTTSIKVEDSNGKVKNIRNKEAVDEIEYQKLLFEEYINNNKQQTDNDFAENFKAAATDLNIKPKVLDTKIPKRGAGQVQQRGSNQDTKTDAVKSPEKPVKPSAKSKDTKASPTNKPTNTPESPLEARTETISEDTTPSTTVDEKVAKNESESVVDNTDNKGNKIEEVKEVDVDVDSFVAETRKAQEKAKNKGEDTTEQDLKKESTSDTTKEDTNPTNRDTSLNREDIGVEPLAQNEADLTKQIKKFFKVPQSVAKATASLVTIIQDRISNIKTDVATIGRTSTKGAEAVAADTKRKSANKDDKIKLSDENTQSSIESDSDSPGGITLKEAVKRNNGNPLSQTPDGKPSKLYKDILALPEINGDRAKADKYKAQIYSDNFKNWFGDWQGKDNKDVSKVVDENGEPLLVYHGTPSIDLKGGAFREDPQRSGIFFARNLDYANRFNRGGQIIPVFLNVKSPVVNDIGIHSSHPQFREDISSPENDGVFGEDFGTGEPVIAVRINTVIKSVFNNGNFSQTDNRIKFSNEKSVTLEDAVAQINDQETRLNDLIKAGRKAFIKSKDPKRKKEIKEYIKKIEKIRDGVRESRKGIKKSNDGIINRAAIVELNDTQAMIVALESPNSFSFVHETFHAFKKALNKAQRQTLIDAYNTAFNKRDRKNKDQFDIDVEEYSARLWERYFANGKVLTEEMVPKKTLRNKLQNIFNTFTKYAQEAAKIFTNRAGITVDVEISPEVQNLFDSLLGINENANTNQFKDTKKSKPKESFSTDEEGIKINNEAFSDLLKRLGFGDISQFDAERLTQEELYETVLEKGLLDDSVAMRIVSDVLLNKQRVTVEESFALGVHIVKRRKIRDDLQKQLDKSLKLKEQGVKISDSSIRQQAALIRDIDGTLYDMIEAYREVGRQDARGLRFRASILQDTIFDEKARLNKLEKLKGKELTEAEEADVKKAYKEFIDSSKQLRDVEKVRDGDVNKRLLVAVKREIDRIATVAKFKTPDVNKSIANIKKIINNKDNRGIKFSSVDRTAERNAVYELRNNLKNYAYSLIKDNGVTDIAQIVSEVQKQFGKSISPETVQLAILQGNKDYVKRAKTNLQTVKSNLRRQSRAVKNIDDIISQALTGKTVDGRTLKRVSKNVSELFHPLVVAGVSEQTYADMAEIATEIASKLNRQPLTINDIKQVRDEIVKLRDAAKVNNVDKQIAKIDNKIKALNGPNPDLSVLDSSTVPKDIEFISEELKAKRKERTDKREQLLAIEEKIIRKQRVEKGYPFLGQAGTTSYAKFVKNVELEIRKEGWEAFRTLKAMFDMSMVLNQAGTFTLNVENWRNGIAPEALAVAFKTFKGVKEDETSQDIYNSILNGEYYKFMEIGGLDVINPDNPYESEEWFSSNLIEKLPVLGRVKRASERTYTSYMNVVRAGLFENYIKANPDIMFNKPALEGLADQINAMTGRGKSEFLGRSINLSSFGQVIFAPRYYWSKIRTLGNMMTAGVLIKEPSARRIFRRQMGGFVLTYASTMALLGLAGAEFEWDPKKKDALRAKFGDTSIEFSAGLGQWIRLAMNLYGTYTNNDDIDAKGKPSNQFFNTSTTSSDVVMNFLKYKVHPALSAMWLVADGKDAIGRPLGDTQSIRYLNVIKSTILPISIGQVSDEVFRGPTSQDKTKGVGALVDAGINGSLALSWFGGNVVEYENRAKDKKVYDYFDSLNKPIPGSTTKKLKDKYRWLESEYWKYYFKKDFQDLLGKWTLEQLEAGKKPSTDKINSQATKIREKLAKDFEKLFAERLNRSSDLAEKIKPGK